MAGPLSTNDHSRIKDWAQLVFSISCLLESFVHLAELILRHLGT